MFMKYYPMMLVTFISLVFHRKVIKTDVYLAITNIDNDDNNVDIESYRRRLESAIQRKFSRFFLERRNWTRKATLL